MKAIKLLLIMAASSAIMALSLSDDVIQLTGGTYGVIDLPKGKKLTISGYVKIGNINISGENEILITDGSELELSGSLHQNGNVIVRNNGKLRVNNYEVQNGNNVLYNNGEMHGNVGQILDCSSVIYNNGTIEFNSFQANCGSIIIYDCARFKTKHLDVNQDQIFSGTGILIVTNSMNANKIIGSPGLRFYYPHTVNGNKDIGLIKVDEQWVCQSLPVIWSSIKFLNGLAEFEVVSPEDIRTIEIQVSKNGYTWRTVKIIEEVSEKNIVPFETK